MNTETEMMMNNNTEMVEVNVTVTKEVKKSVKPSFVNAGHFKNMTVVFYVLKQMEMMNMVNDETMQSMRQLIGIGASADTVKTFYEEMSKELENTAELLAKELETYKPVVSKKRAKKVVEAPKTMVDELIQIANMPTDTDMIVATVNTEDKPKRKYTKKTKTETETENKETVAEDAVVEKPKRKYTKKAKTETVVTTEQVVENVTTEQVVEPVVTEQVVEKPKRKYTKKAKTEAVVENVVTEQIVENVVTEQIVEKKPKKNTKKPKTETNSDSDSEKPKRKYNKTKEQAVVIADEPVVVSEELTKDSYTEEEPARMVIAVTIDGVEYLLDEETNEVFDVDSEQCVGKLVDGKLIM
jgi:hypothetical protein